MTRPLHAPVSNIREHLQVHHRGYEDMVVIVCTLLFLGAGAYIAVTQLLPTMR